MTAGLLFHVLLALAVVVAAGRLLGRLVARIGQPPVIGEVIGGILLGPSLLGLVWPQAAAWLFPESVRAPLDLIAQIGVVAYMFLIGLEFDARLLKGRAASLLVTSQASIVAPFALGCALAALLHDSSAPAGVSRTVFAMFMGVAMSITAFPVLARILADRSLTRTQLGVAALTCAAINDVMAWSLLALVVGLSPALPTSGVPGELVLAFAAGAVIPVDSRFARVVAVRLHGVVTVLLLPAFFALTGLRTEIALVSSAFDWLVCAGIVAVATAGKFGGATLAGWMTGMSWRFAARLGALMNTRGLMELIVLTVGLKAGIITPRLFTMMVIMALVTTAMTAPLLDLMSVSDDPGRDASERSEASHANGASRRSGERESV